MEEYDEDCPNALPFGDDIGDKVYFYVCDGEETSVYMCEKSMRFDKEFWNRVANSFTDSFAYSFSAKSRWLSVSRSAVS